MTDRPRNTAASIYGRLTNYARKMGRPFGEVLQYYGMERFLYRLSKTEYADSLILKGGLLFHVWGLPLRRPTKDIDFLGLLDNKAELLRQVVSTAISVPDPDGGLEFDVATLTMETSQIDADRNGLRIRFAGYLARSKIPMQIDVGFSDEIPGPLPTARYPTLLSDMVSPLIKGYPPEFVVAEKLHSLERFAETPSRWKDYYDLWLISDQYEFSEQPLQTALWTTFTRRKTGIPLVRPASLSMELSAANQGNWQRFLHKNGLENDAINDLSSVVDQIWLFLESPLQNMGRDNAHSGKRHWMPKERKWI